MYCKNKRLFPTTFSWSALIRVPCSAYKTLYASCNGTEATENNKYTRVQLFYSLYVHRYIFIFIYVHKYSERERENKKTLYQIVKVQYMSRVRKMDGFPLVSSRLNKVQKIIAGWHRFRSKAKIAVNERYPAPSGMYKTQGFANSKPSTGFLHHQQPLNNRRPSSENFLKNCRLKIKGLGTTLPGNFPSPNPRRTDILHHSLPDPCFCCNNKKEHHHFSGCQGFPPTTKKRGCFQIKSN